MSDVLAFPRFELDQAPGLFEIFFEQAQELHYVLERGSGRFLLVNKKFAELTGYDAKDIEAGLTAYDIIAEQDLARIRARAARDDDEEERPQRYTFRTKTRGGELRWIDVIVRDVLYQGKECVLGSGRDVTLAQRQNEKHRRANTDLMERNRAIFLMAEKIRAVPAMTTDLLDAESVDDILRHTQAHLSERRGFNLAGVRVMLCDEQGCALPVQSGVLAAPAPGATAFLPGSAAPDGAASRTLPGSGRTGNGDRHPKQGTSPHSAPAGGDPRADDPLSAVALGRRDDHWTADLCAVPLRAEGRVIGALGAVFHPAEWAMMAANLHVSNAIRHEMQSVGQILGLAISNRRLFEEVQRRAVVDQLTGVYNRRWLDQKLDEEYKRAVRYDRDFSVMIIDLDHFKPINDTYSHLEGDGILRAVAKLFRASFREIDTVTRYGGDEFVILMPETGAADAGVKAESLRRAVEDRPFPNGADAARPHRLSLSIGVAGLRRHLGASPAELLARADEALYAAKRGGRNRVTVAGAPGGGLGSAG